MFAPGRKRVDPSRPAAKPGLEPGRPPGPSPFVAAVPREGHFPVPSSLQTLGDEKPCGGPGRYSVALPARTGQEGTPGRRVVTRRRTACARRRTAWEEDTDLWTYRDAGTIGVDVARGVT